MDNMHRKAIHKHKRVPPRIKKKIIHAKTGIKKFKAGKPVKNP